MLAEDHLGRLVAALIRDEMCRRRLPEPRAGLDHWPDDMRIDEEGLGFDSLARIELVQALERRLDLGATGVDDYLLIEPTLGGWARLLAIHFRNIREAARLTFFSSGSAGEPKPASHSLGSLWTEAATLLPLIGLPCDGRVIALVPPQHIFGFIFSIVLPGVAKVPVVDLHRNAPGALSRQVRSGDLVVATPHRWELALQTCASLPPGVRGVTSGGPAGMGVWQGVTKAGAERFTEIFGSTETSGLGTRTSPDKPFRLMRHLARVGDEILNEGRQLDLQDDLTWIDDVRFRVTGRRDGKVTVAGANVDPAAVQRNLASQPGVSEAAVRHRNDRLHAFIVPAAGAEVETLERDLRRSVAKVFPAPARPISYDFGAVLPRNSIGKLCDWLSST